MPRFNGICILTPDVERLGRFYQDLLHVPVVCEGDNMAFQTEGAQLTIFSFQGMERMAPGIMQGAGFGGCTFDFQVESVDEAHAQLIQAGVPCVKPPITYPWGRRSAWFRDPDGNIVNLFEAVEKAA